MMHAKGGLIAKRVAIQHASGSQDPKHVLTGLTLDLLTGPAGCLLGARGELFVGTGVTSHAGDPLGAEELRDLAVGKGFRQVTVLGSAMCHRKTLSQLRTQ